ncbi:MAG: hypothetical protein ACLSAF_11200 [Intestinimonas sp.]
MSKRYAVFLTVLFCAFLGVFFAANLITPDRTFSPQENRYLTQRPSLSAEDFRMRLPLRDSGDFFTGTFMSEFEQYITDQFVGRDGWIAARPLPSGPWEKGRTTASICARRIPLSRALTGRTKKELRIT